MANVSLNFGSLRSNHPDYNEIRKFISSMPSYVDETCAVQLSYALNKSNGVIGDYAYPDPTIYTGKVRAFQDDDGLSYIFGVPDLRVYLNNVYGRADNYKGTQQQIT